MVRWFAWRGYNKKKASQSFIILGWQFGLGRKVSQSDLEYCAKVMQTIIDKYRTLFLRFLANISAKHRMDCRTLNRDIGTIFTISCRDIVLVRLCCNDISQSKTIYHHDISLQRSSLQRYVVVNCASTIYRNEAIVYDESVFVYML